MTSADSATAVEERIWLWRRLQLGEWLNSFLVAVGAGHGSAEVVLLAAGIFQGRPLLQAREVRSGEGRREACVQRESLD
uniref:Uncharacterized protein n=1 Tax=Populus trichocarpa TaxID=3694 RepID=U5GSD5_POPTR